MMCSPEGKSLSEYSLEILLPESVERELRHWAETVPRATWPHWGGHITVLNRFTPTQGIEPIIQEVQRACAEARPFHIRLNEVVTDRHWRDPQLKAVFLESGSKDDEGYCSLVQLHNGLRGKLEEFKRDMHPEISNRPYVPHLSLTVGQPEHEASRLADAAREARIEVKFSVASVSLLEFIPEPSGKERIGQVQSFQLGNRS